MRTETSPPFGPTRRSQANDHGGRVFNQIVKDYRPSVPGRTTVSRRRPMSNLGEGWFPCNRHAAITMSVQKDQAMRVRLANEDSCVVQSEKGVDGEQGPHLDLKMYPERADEIPEAKAWPALGRFVEAINRTATFQTTCCNDRGRDCGHKAAFVALDFDDPRLRGLGFAHMTLQQVLMTLDGHNAGSDLVVEIAYCKTTTTKYDRHLSTKLWLLGTQEQAEEAFGPILSLLAQQNVADYIRAAMPESDEREMLDPKIGCLRVVLAAVIAFVAGALVAHYLPIWRPNA